MSYKKTFLIKFFFVFVILSQVSCGYQPIYNKQNKSALKEFHSIYIKDTNTKIGKIIREELLKKIVWNKEKNRYTLIITEDSSSSGIVTETNTRITRYEIQINAELNLFENNKDKKVVKLLNSKFTSRSSHRVLPDNITATISSEKAAIKRASFSIAQSMYDELQNYFITKK